MTAVPADTLGFEDRGRDGFPYDERSASHVIHPNGSLMATTHRGLSGSLARLVVEEVTR